MPTALMYHDIVRPDRADSTGFPGPAAARYKICPAEFEDHLHHLRTSLEEAPIATDEPGRLDKPNSVLLTFDDGGVSCYTAAAELLDRAGWRGYFFMPTDQIQTPGFLDPPQLRSLRAQGHVIGSHSCSHPVRMWACGEKELLREWGRSKAILEDVLGEHVTTGSVPGGFFSRKVAQAAARAGLRVLFTSEPTCRAHTVDGCLVLGRYTIRPGMAGEKVAAITCGRSGPRFRQAVSWNVKKVAKRLTGNVYLRVCRRLLEGT
jgi:peptidoglycan/xylan/chitin deacetylase (PgdA/CDA1 family)